MLLEGDERAGLGVIEPQRLLAPEPALVPGRGPLSASQRASASHIVHSIE